MKIVGFTRSHNESDVIESLLRYYSQFCDVVIFQDNNSSDNTREIAESLAEEGLPIEVLEGVPNQFDTSWFAMGNGGSAVEYAFEQKEADLFVPFDSDEFFFDPSGENPRKAFENLNPEDYYQIPWRTFIYDGDPDDDTRFLPSFFTSYRAPEMELYSKTVLSRYLWKERDAKFSVGNHSLFFGDEAAEPTGETSLRCGHFPVRSKNQIMLKVLLNHYDSIARGLDNPLIGYHQRILYEYLQRHGTVTDKQVQQMSKTYSLSWDRDASTEDILEVQIPTVEGSLNVDFCKDKLGLKYTNYHDTQGFPYFLNIFTNDMDGLVRRQHEGRKNLETQVRLLNNQLNQMADKYVELDNKANDFMAKIEGRKPSTVTSHKVGRNEPCPCGSGKKYKKCCGAES